jgi:hypothetical protein
MAIRSSLILAIAAAFSASRATAQTVVSGIRDLNFGVVIQGVATSVAPTDPVKSGQFYFRTPGIGSRARIQFTLPTRLNGPAGATMPITFQNTDGFIQGTAPTSIGLTFNPNATSTFNMVTSADANVWLGGRVTPAINQTVGAYTNTVIMTVTVF